MSGNTIKSETLARLTYEQALGAFSAGRIDTSDWEAFQRVWFATCPVPTSFLGSPVPVTHPARAGATVDVPAGVASRDKQRLSGHSDSAVLVPSGVADFLQTWQEPDEYQPPADEHPLTIDSYSPAHERALLNVWTPEISAAGVDS